MEKFKINDIVLELNTKTNVEILDYEKLSVTSKNLFDSVFAEELSRKRLLEIINTSFSRKS
jgi:hypothetical protein